MGNKTEKIPSKNGMDSYFFLENPHQSEPLETVKCHFHCPHLVHKMLSDETQCILEEKHLNSVLCFDHKFDCRHESLKPPKIQIVFICAAKFSFLPIIKNIIKILGDFLAKNMKLYPEFAVIIYKNHDQRIDYVIKFVDFGNEKTAKKFLDEVQNEIFEDDCLEEKSIFYGVEKALKLSWVKNAEHYAFILNRPLVFLGEEINYCQNPKFSIDLQIDGILKDCEKKKINFFMFQTEEKKDEIQNFLENKLKSRMKKFNFDEFPGNLISFLRETFIENKIQNQKRLICFDSTKPFLSLKFLNQEIEEYDDSQKLIQIIENSLDFFIIITTVYEENFVKTVHEMKNILAILVFCNNLEFHQKWMKHYQKIHFVTFRENDLHKEIMRLKTSHCAYYVSEINYEFSVEDNIPIEFWRVVFYYFKHLRENNESITF